MNYKQENRICQDCKGYFTIDENDFNYYKKIDVLPPKICPDCRSQLRMTFRNERFFYKRTCNNCKQSVISSYSENKDFPVWCHDCWWKDDLDAKSFGLDYDPSRPFLEQFKKLLETVPKPALIGGNNTNCSYLNLAADNKGCYMIIESSNNENCMNCYWIQLSKELVDCSFTNKVELSYQADDCQDSSNLIYCKGCYSCLNSAFLLDCRGCTSCLGCINLREQKYNIFNVQYTKEEYEQKLASYKLDTYTGMENFKKEFNEFIKNQPRKFAEITNAINSTGNYMVNVKNTKQCFHTYDSEDNAYSMHVWREAKDCMDCNTAGRSAELVYNSLNMGMKTSHIISSFHCWGSQFMTYCFNCPSSHDCFGCSSLVKGSYCILNKQYTKEEYEKLRGEIIEKMKAEGVYGDFFPKDFSPLGYNESSAIDDFPLSKEEALAQGFKWEDTERGTYGKGTIDWNNFPDSILEIPEDFDANKEIFTCMTCEKNYRVIVNELTFYKRMKIPLPRTCPECRHVARYKNRGPNKLWHRVCMCDKVAHGHESKCPNEFETSYSPEGDSLVYCESCYNKEVY